MVDLLVRACFVSLVYTPWRVASFFGSVLSLILAVPLFISLCVHHLRKRHMMGLLPILRYVQRDTPRPFFLKKTMLCLSAQMACRSALAASFRSLGP
jgi:hypothetical protein